MIQNHGLRINIVGNKNGTLLKIYRISQNAGRSGHMNSMNEYVYILSVCLLL